MERGSERLGVAAGNLLGPLVALATSARRSRLFHPLGDVYEGVATPLATGPLASVGRRLAGPVLARFSGGAWKHARPWPDVLGIALRFHSGTPHPGQPADQDLLLITSRALWRLPIAVWRTDTRDFLRNTYYAGPPFETSDACALLLRLTPEWCECDGADRRERLRSAVDGGVAAATLEGGLRHSRAWSPLARLVFTSPLAIDQEALRFSPFRNGRGLTPRGFTHAVRKHAYVAAQRARDSSRT